MPGIRETIKLGAMQKLSMYMSVIQKAELVCCAKDGVEATISFRPNLATRGMTVDSECICVESTLLRAPSHFRLHPRFFDALDDFANTAQAPLTLVQPGKLGIW